MAASGSYARTSRDAEGNGQAWVRGEGYVINGRTGERIEMGVVHEDTTNTFRLTDRHGSPFAVADANGNLTPLRTGLPDGEGWIKIIGKEIQIPGKPKGTFGRDVFNIHAPEITYRGRDGHGNPATFDWDGTGWGRTAEGEWVGGQPSARTPRDGGVLDQPSPFSLTEPYCTDKQCFGPDVRFDQPNPFNLTEPYCTDSQCFGPTTRDARDAVDGSIPLDKYDAGVEGTSGPRGAHGKISITTRDGNGLGGSITIDGDGKVRAPGGVTLDCDNCIGTHYMPTKKGAGGINTCAIRPGGSCTGEDEWTNGRSDTQRLAAPSLELPFAAHDKPGGADDKPVAEFVQYLRGDDGSGGGAVVFINGDAEASGTDAYGNWVSTWGKGGRSALPVRGEGRLWRPPVVPAGRERWMRRFGQGDEVDRAHPGRHRGARVVRRGLGSGAVPTRPQA